MNKSKPPEFESLDDLVEFFDTHDMGEYDLPEVHFDIDIQRETWNVNIDAGLMNKVRNLARSRHTSARNLVDLWLRERLAEEDSPREVNQLGEKKPRRRMSQITIPALKQRKTTQPS